MKPGMGTPEQMPPMEIPEELVLRARDGDSAAVLQLYTDVEPIVRRTVERTAWSQPNLVEELTTDALHHVITKGLDPDRFRGGNYAAFATTASKRLTLNSLIAHQRRRRSETLTIEPETIEATTPDRSSAFDPEIQLLESSATSRIGTMLDAAGVSEQFRQPFVMHYAYGMSGEEIAAELGIPMNTVRTRIHRAKRAVQNHYRITEDETRPWDIFEDPGHQPLAEAA